MFPSLLHSAFWGGVGAVADALAGLEQARLHWQRGVGIVASYGRVLLSSMEQRELRRLGHFAGKRGLMLQVVAGR